MIRSWRKTWLAWLLAGTITGLLAPGILLWWAMSHRGSTRDVRQSEGCRFGGELSSELRRTYANQDEKPVAVSDIHRFRGQYYAAVNVVGRPESNQGEVFVVPLDAQHSTLRVVFPWQGGSPEYECLNPDHDQ